VTKGIKRLKEVGEEKKKKKERLCVERERN
jgi:hypothetical protein